MTVINLESHLVHVLAAYDRLGYFFRLLHVISFFCWMKEVVRMHSNGHAEMSTYMHRFVSSLHLYLSIVFDILLSDILGATRLVSLVEKIGCIYICAWIQFNYKL